MRWGGILKLLAMKPATFLNYAWPGNVRQLQNVVRNIVVLHNAKVVEAHMIPPLEEASPSADVSMSRADTVALPVTPLRLASLSRSRRSI